MSEDIIKRLRVPPFGTETSERHLMSAAADEIERLRAELAEERAMVSALNGSVTELGQRVAELEAAQEWRPIGGLMHKHGPVLGMIEMMGQRRCEEVYRCPLGVVRATKDGFAWSYATHWLPLPPAPARPAGAKGEG